MSKVLFNMTDYTLLEHLLFGIGCFMWVIVYGIIIGKIRKYQFIEIPMMVICLNFSWEILWSWFFYTDMGAIYQWGYRVWFLMDCYIVYHAFKYCYKQYAEGSMLREHARTILAVAIVGWIVILYFFTKTFDAPKSHMGGYGGYWCNLPMSMLYISLLWRYRDKLEYFSLPAAWLKGWGTGLVTVFCFFHFDDPFLFSLGTATALLDAYYIYQFYVLRKKARLNVSME
ncbi:MAG: hypothetical protein KDC54_25310 [Lewinella sp.]|nr:hypothetical protein [Lewinella sp.]